MTKTLVINEVPTLLSGLLALAQDGDESLSRKTANRSPRSCPFRKRLNGKKRTAGLGKGIFWVSEDFDDELPVEFWGFDKEL